jgi:6-phosphofructo-2-kinase / fructose-2,6-biphosphatase 2
LDREDLDSWSALLALLFSLLFSSSLLDEIVSSLAASVRTSPDFTSEADFRQRVSHYQSSYETVKEEEGSYIKVEQFSLLSHFLLISSPLQLIGTTGENIHLHGITGFLRTKISSFVMNVHTSPRTIYLVRAGESEHIARGMIGGGMMVFLAPPSSHTDRPYLLCTDSGLTTDGAEFAKALGDLLTHDDTGFSVAPSEGYVVWSSTMKSAVQTSHSLPSSSVVEWRALREIEAGVCDGLTYDQIKVRYPKEYQARQQAKLTYRYPRGESYFDVITRLEPLIFEVDTPSLPLLLSLGSARDLSSPPLNRWSV